MNITLLLPTRKRPLLLQRMFNSAIENAKYPDLIEMSLYVDKDDFDTQEHLKNMKGNIQITIGERIILSEMWNRAYEKASANILMDCGDDIIFRSKDWDEKIMKIFNLYEDKIVFVYGNDLAHGQNLGTHGFLHRKWIETLGYFVPPYFSSDYNDTWLNEIAEALGRRIFLPDVITEHMHWSFGKGELDITHKERMERGTRDNVGQLYKKLEYKRQTDIQKLRNAIDNYKPIKLVTAYNRSRIYYMSNLPISILVRTHKRPKALQRCLLSLDKQTKKNFSVIIISDYKEDNVEKLADQYPNLSFIFIHVEPLGYPGCNLYFNQIKDYVYSDYVIFIDDNDIVTDNTYLETIENIFNMGFPAAIISKAQFPGRIIPPDSRWGSIPEIGNISTLNFCVRTDMYQKGNWTDSPVGDFHFIKGIFDIVDQKKDVYWYNQVVVTAGEYPSLGKSEY